MHQHRRVDALTRIGLWVRANIRHIIIVQTFVLIAWIVVNVYAIFGLHFDPYPFILLNLTLSFQAAYTGPLLLLSDDIAAAGDADLQHQQLELMHIVRESQLRQDRMLAAIERMEKKTQKEVKQVEREVETKLNDPPLTGQEKEVTP